MREIKDAMPKKHEPKKYMMMNEKIAHTSKNFKAKERERHDTGEHKT
jgi:hypothetical protein